MKKFIIALVSVIVFTLEVYITAMLLVSPVLMIGVCVSQGIGIPIPLFNGNYITIWIVASAVVHIFLLIYILIQRHKQRKRQKALLKAIKEKQKREEEKEASKKEDK